MNSLKKKFGKFAVSTEKMAKVNGGNGYLMADCGGSLIAAATLDSLYELAYSDYPNETCTMIA